MSHGHGPLESALSLLRQSQWQDIVPIFNYKGKNLAYKQDGYGQSHLYRLVVKLDELTRSRWTSIRPRFILPATPRRYEKLAQEKLEK